MCPNENQRPIKISKRWILKIKDWSKDWSDKFRKSEIDENIKTINFENQKPIKYQSDEFTEFENIESRVPLHFKLLYILAYISVLTQHEHLLVYPEGGRQCYFKKYEVCLLNTRKTQIFSVTLAESFFDKIFFTALSVWKSFCFSLFRRSFTWSAVDDPPFIFLSLPPPILHYSDFMKLLSLAKTFPFNFKYVSFMGSKKGLCYIYI